MAIKTTEQLRETKAQVNAEKETFPLPLCDQVTDPVGKNPVTVALHAIVFVDATGRLLGPQEIVVCDALMVTFRSKFWAEGEFFESPW